MRRLAAVLLAVFCLAPAAAGGSSPRPETAKVRPRLAVILAVDGLSWDRLKASRPWFTAGLKRLLDEGAVATECRYGHLGTETGPGHASIATGTPPRVHGIALNQWFALSPDGTAMREIYSGAQPLPGEAEATAKTVPGPGRLRVATLGDRMSARDARAKVVAISNKDRAAILLAGRDARHAVYWYAVNSGTYVTSAAYDAASPEGRAAAGVIARFNEGRAGANLAAHYGTTWSRPPSPSPIPAGGYEAGLDPYQDPIVGPLFPHDLAAAKRPFSSALLWTPIADRMLADLAVDLLDDDELGLGRGDVPDLLAVSFSANDYVSHYYGPESIEDLEVLRALDLTIGRLLDALTVRFGQAGVLVALSADHGFLPIPEVTTRKETNGPGVRVLASKILDQLNVAVNTALDRTDPPPLIYRFESGCLWLNRAALQARGAPDAKRVLAIARRELATTWKDVVATTFVVDDLPSHSRDDVERRAWNARVPGRSGELFVVPRFGVLIDDGGGKGSSHGSPWDYDTHVPLIFWGGGVVAGERSAPSTPYDLAPTLAAWLHVKLPAATGHRLNVW